MPVQHSSSHCARLSKLPAMFLRLLLLAAVVAVGLAVNITTNDCPQSLPRTHLRVFRHSCYFFVLDHQRDFDSAEAECKSTGGHLVIIRDLETQNFLYRTMRYDFYYGGVTWIGLSDSYSEGHFTWMDGSPTRFTHWAIGQPGLMGTLEDCVAMVMLEGGRWHDFRCNDFLFVRNRHTFVCEYPVAITTQTSTTREPATTAREPSTPTPQPTTTTPQPSTPMRQPTTTTHEPATTTPQPTTTTPQPITTMRQPTTITPQPTATTPQSTATTPQPTATTPESTATTPQPATTTPQSTTTTPQPATTINSDSSGSTECPPLECSLDCGLAGFKMNGNGCLLCQCED